MDTSLKGKYLKEVIVRIDFANKLEFIDDELPKDFDKLILKLFPIKEPKTIKEKEIILNVPSGEGVDVKDHKKKEWHFFGKNREKKLFINENSLYITYKDYDSFERLKNDFLSVVSKLFSSFTDVQVNRLGLRYINNISLDNIERRKWKKHISKKLLYIFDIPPNSEKKKIARGFNSITLNYGDMNLLFQFGIANPDFPAPIKRNIFILDYDAYYENLFDEKEVVESLELFHGKIKDFFSMSIPKGGD